MNCKKLIAALLLAALLPEGAFADEVPFMVSANLFDTSQPQTMGLSFASGIETVTVWEAQAEGQHYANGVVMAAFKDGLYCMWQSSAKDEDADDTFVAYSRSTDGGQTWSEPMVLCPTLPNGYCASGGWLSTADRLIGYINVRTKDIANNGGYTQYVESEDGMTWTLPQNVLMADGTQLNGIFEQDPHVLSDGRIISAAHFQPGLKLCPIYTDDPTGRTGWKKGTFTSLKTGTQTYELEPSFFLQQDGTLVMTMRDQGGGSYHVLASVSRDRGETWTQAVKTDMPDSRAKQSAGNLPDGTAYICNNPGRVTNSANKTWRVPLALTLSKDGQLFDHALLLRSGSDGDYPALRYEGKSKTLGYSYPKSMVHQGWLYVSYSTNKEAAQYTRVPINNISLGVKKLTTGELFSISDRRLTVNCNARIEVYDLRGCCMLATTVAKGETADLAALPAGLYVVRVRTSNTTSNQKVMLR